MPLLQSSQLPPPIDDKEFEELARDLFAAHWKDPNTQIFGRSGQTQDGVDIYGRPNQQEFWYGIQCKLRKAGDLSRQKLEIEIHKARNFHHKLHTYIFVTTYSRDTKLQKFIDELDLIEESFGKSHVQILFWEDICSLLAENINIARKYYPQFFQGGPIVERQDYHPKTHRFTEISENSPMLLGLVIDCSRSMINILKDKQGFQDKDLQTVLNLVVEKATAFCETTQAGEILPKFSLFVYGYGFADLLKGVSNAFNRLLGIQESRKSSSPIQSGSVRDLLANVATENSLPFTPNILVLNKHWDTYKRSIRSQFFDMGLGESSFYESLCAAHERLSKELESPFYAHPLLLFISDGQIDDGLQTDVERVTKSIQDLGVQVMHCYVGKRDITKSKILYASSEALWPEEAIRLFNLSSRIGSTNILLANISDEAKYKGWHVPDGARLFIQLNHSEMLEEVIDILLSALRY